MAAALLAVGLGGTAGVLWWGSLLPARYSSMSMGYADFGGGPTFGHPAAALPQTGHAAHTTAAATQPAPDVPVTELVADPQRPADVRFELTTRQQDVRLVDGRTVPGFTVNGRSPGPTLHLAQGQLAEVVLVNADVADGTTLHWHGLEVPNGADGVAGVTQDAVPPGGRHVYRFVAGRAGTFWYHSHQVSDPQVTGGLLGAIVVHPAGTTLPPSGGAADPVLPGEVVALAHTYGGVRTLNGAVVSRLDAAAGERVRVRVINTDPGPMPVWVAGAGYRVLAVDGRELNGPTPVSGRAVLLTAGARADLEIVVPPGGARVQVAGASLVLGDGEPGPVPAPRERLDLLTYGTPVPPAFRADEPDRVFEYRIGRRFGLFDGRPGLWWTINGHLLPDVPMFMVREGDVVAVHVVNDSAEVHPMHLHGHHVTVLSRDGVPSTGSPWVVDSLNVEAGESYVVAFVADNPGIWMDHCHNLKHAEDGLVTHLMYEGVSTPFEIGAGGNQPE